METGIRYLEYRALSVKIIQCDSNSNERPLGSGVLFPRSAGELALVLTTPHIFPNINTKNRYKLTLAIKDDADTIHKITNDFSVASAKGNNTEFKIYYPDTFDADSLENDAAIITIPWENWMLNSKQYEMRKVDLNSEVIGWGFPGGMSENGSLPSDQNNAARLKGELADSDGDHFMLEYESRSVANDSREDEMMGFSGTAMFSIEHNRMAFVGCISRPVGDETVGSRVRLSGVGLYKRIMKENGLLPSIPKTFTPFKELVIKQFDKDIHRKEYNFFNMVIDELIDELNLIPFHCIDGCDKYLSQCEKNISIMCPLFWKGQLIRTVMFYKVLGCDIKSLKSFFIGGNGYSEKIFFEYICTEQTIRDYIIALLTDKYTADRVNKDEGTIFLWNGTCRNKDHNLDKYVERSIIKGIHLSITNPYGWGSEQSGYDIRYGKADKSNFAVIDLEFLVNLALLKSDCKTQLMRENIMNFIKDIWEIKECAH